MANIIRNRKIALGVLSLFIIIGVFLFGFLIGHGQLKLEEGYKPVLINKELGKPKEVDFSQFWEIWNRVENDYLGDYDKQEMVYGAIKGMIISLGDPYSVFMNPEEAKEFLADLEGEISGIGAEVGEKNQNIVIVAPLPGSPAEEAGLLPGDIILEINGKDISLFTIEQAVTEIRGEAGTTVSLKVKREGQFENRTFKITREEIKIPSVLYKQEGKIGYINIIQFSDDTASLVEKYIGEAKANNSTGLILDLRSNPGGLLTSAVEISEMFVGKDNLIVSEELKNNQKDEYRSTEDPLWRKEIVVLINGGSASASEIVAGAIKDNNKGTLIGETTFGKGTVQDFEQYSNESALRLTVARWLTPNGINLAETGIEPDITVKMPKGVSIGSSKDSQLNRGLRELK